MAVSASKQTHMNGLQPDYSKVGSVYIHHAAQLTKPRGGATKHIETGQFFGAKAELAFPFHIYFSAQTVDSFNIF